MQAFWSYAWPAIGSHLNHLNRLILRLTHFLCMLMHPNVSTGSKISHSKLTDLPLINIDLIHLPSCWQGQNSANTGFKFLVLVNTIPCSLYSRHTVLNPLHTLTCLLFILTMYGTYNHYFHCAYDRTGQELVSSLPKITQLLRGRPKVWTQKVWIQSLCSLPLTVYTFQVRYLHSKICGRVWFLSTPNKWVVIWVNGSRLAKVAEIKSSKEGWEVTSPRDRKKGT